MKLKILTPSGSVVDGIEVSAVFLSGTLGEFEVLPDHAPIISSLERGDIRWREDGQEKGTSINSGFVTVRDNVVEACVEI
ncbi:MAG: F0F1 ATP synthase subunit epsilon [Bacteroidales bacterium]|nr:F0F1 ATP synthase subunit epsilon [Bacteroidales bacterium]